MIGDRGKQTCTWAKGVKRKGLLGTYRDSKGSDQTAPSLIRIFAVRLQNRFTEHNKPKAHVFWSDGAVWQAGQCFAIHMYFEDCFPMSFADCFPMSRFIYTIYKIYAVLFLWLSK